MGRGCEIVSIDLNPTYVVAKFELAKYKAKYLYLASHISLIMRVLYVL